MKAMIATAGSHAAMAKYRDRVGKVVESADLDYLILADAGRGRGEGSKAARFWPWRMKQVFDITYSKTQDAGRARVHLAGETRQIKGFVHAYLGMKDANLPVPVTDLVRREDVEQYPTNFNKMPLSSLNAITVRAEQLTRVLLAHYCPDLP